MKQIHIWKEDTVETDYTATTSIVLELPNKTRKSIWYRIPVGYASQLTSSMDSFVVATIYVGMTVGADLRIHGEVSPSLLQNIEMFQTIWKCWRPEAYPHKVQIIADTERELPIATNLDRDIMAFSGGVDSSFTAFSHFHKLRGRLNRNIKAGVLIQSSVPPFASDDLFKPPYENLAAMLANLGLELIPMMTNAYSALRPNRLRDHFIPVAISCLMLFQGKYRAGLLASSEPYEALVTPWSTHPLTDPLLIQQLF